MLMNREQRRKYAKRMKNDKLAFMCPKCHMKARFISKAQDDGEVIIICEACGEIVRQGPEITKRIPAGLYLPVSPETFDLMIEKMDKEEEMKDVLEGNKDSDDAKQEEPIGRA